jgi:hypothetical protein
LILSKYIFEKFVLLKQLNVNFQNYVDNFDKSIFCLKSTDFTLCKQRTCTNVCAYLLLHCTLYRRGAICVDYLWTRILSINPFHLQQQINSESRTSSDFYYIKSHIGFHFGDSQHVILMNENGNKFRVLTAGKAV